MIVRFPPAVPSPRFTIIAVAFLLAKPSLRFPIVIDPVPFTVRVLLEPPARFPAPSVNCWVPILKTPPLTFSELVRPPIKISPVLLTVPPDWFKTAFPPPSSPRYIPVALRIPDPLTVTVPFELADPAITKFRTFAALVWVRLPVTFRTPTVVEVTPIPPVVLRFPERVSVPVLIEVVPFQEFAVPERVRVPFPDLVRPLAPPRTLPETARF